MPNIPLAMAAVAMFADTRVRFWKNFNGISGSVERDSTTTSASNATTPPTSGPTTANEPHGLRAAARNPSTSASTPPVANTAPGRSKRREVRSALLSSTSRGMSMIAAKAIGALMKKIQRQSR